MLANILDLNQYKILRKIGFGNFSDVYKIKSNQKEDFFAAKIMKSENDELSESNYRNLEREINISSDISYPLVIKCFGYSPVDFDNKPKHVIITELMNNGSLNDIIEKSVEDQQKIGWNDTLKLVNIYGIAYVLSYLHSKKILHRDLKPANIYVDTFLCPKLGDFGLSKKYDGSSTQSIAEVKGSPLYIAPEIWGNAEYTEKVDVYAFAMIVYQIVTNILPFKDLKSIYDIATAAKAGKHPQFYSPIPDSYKNLIEMCWEYNPSNRPTFDQIVEMLITDPGFITKNVNKEDFQLYINFVKQFENSSDQSNCITDIDKFADYKSKTFTQKVIKPQILYKAEVDDIFEKAKKFKEGDENSKIPKNLEEAARLFKIVADCGNVDAMLEFGKMVLNENGVGVDKKEGAQYLKNAADKDNAEAMYLYGLALSKGDGVTIDHVESSKYYEMASKKKHIDAMYNYAMNLRDGIGVQVDINKAKSLLKESADSGHPRAKLEYERLNYKLDSIEDFELLEYVKGKIIRNGKIKSTSQPVAVKYAINCTIDDLKNECDNLIKCSHPSIQKLIGLYDSSDPNTSAMVTPYCAKGSLDNYFQKLPTVIIDQKGKDDKKDKVDKKDDDDDDEEEEEEEEVDEKNKVENCVDFKQHYKLIYHICHAMKHLESKKMFHGLLNPSNILLDDDCNPIINNIKMKENYSKDEIENTDMINYLAPEILFGEKSSIKSDVYSFGLIIEQIFTKEIPKKDNVYNISEKVPKFLRDIVKKCLVKNPKKRPSFKKILTGLTKSFSGNKNIKYYQNILESQIQYPVTFYRIPKTIVKSPDGLSNQNGDTNQNLISFENLNNIFSKVTPFQNIKIIMVCGKFQSGKSTLLRMITGNGAFYSGKINKTTTKGMFIDGPYYAQDIIDRIKSDDFKNSIKEGSIKKNTAIFFIDSQGIGDKDSKQIMEIMKPYYSFFSALSDVCINISEMAEECDFFEKILNTMRGGQLMRIKFGENQTDKDINKQFTKILFLGKLYDGLNEEIPSKKGFEDIQSDYQEKWDKQHQNVYECYDPKLIKTFPLGNNKSSPFTYNCSVWNIIPEIFDSLNNSIDYTKNCIISKIKDAMIYIFSDFFDRFKQIDNSKIDEQIEYITNYSLEFIQDAISEYKNKKIDRVSTIDSIGKFLNVISNMIIPYTVAQNANLSSQDCNQYAYDLMKDIISYLKKIILELETNLFNSINELYQRDIIFHEASKAFSVPDVSAKFISSTDHLIQDSAISKGMHYITNVFRYFKKKNIIKRMTNEKIGTSIPFLWDKIDNKQNSTNIDLKTISKDFLSKYKNYEFIIVLENKESTFMKFIIQSMTGIECEFKAENNNKETILYGPFSPDFLVNRTSRCFPELKSQIAKEIYILYLRDYNKVELNQISKIQQESLFCLSSNESIGAYPSIKDKLFHMFYFVQKPEIKLLIKKDCIDIQKDLNQKVSKNGYNINYLPILMENSRSFDKIGPQTNKNLRWAFHQILVVKKLEQNQL